IPQIEVTFDIDANGIVNVSAKDLATGKEQHITISSSSNMSKDDINKAVKDAEKYAEEDKKHREVVDAKNNAEQMIYAAEKLVKDSGDKMDSNDKTELESKIAALKESSSKDDTADMKTKSDELQKVLFSISEKLYKNAAPQGNAAGAAPQGGAQPNAPQQDTNGNTVYDADYKDVDDNKDKK
ncbi:MAG: Hsp70 family protein, partial [Oscillospiraceae bacterium]|nr:Hsp70 family protein [Oscillospiraceae bacterium]